MQGHLSEVFKLTKLILVLPATNTTSDQKANQKLVMIDDEIKLAEPFDGFECTQKST